jgi:hypothetical protein
MTDRELLQQALDALEKHVHEYETIQAIKNRLAPPKKEWVGLTDDEKIVAYSMFSTMSAMGFVQAIETKLKEKNV